MCPRRGIPLPLKGPGIACIYPYRPHFKPPLQHSALWLPHSLFGANFRHTMPATPTRHLQIYMIEESSSKTKECKKRNYTYMQEKREKESERELLGVSIGFRGRERNVRWREIALPASLSLSSLAYTYV